MRRIPLGTITFTPNGAPEPSIVPYVELMHAVLFHSDPQRGQSTADLVAGLRIWGVIDKARAGESVKLEDADYTVLSQRLDAFAWGPLAALAPEDCGKFIESIRDAETVDPNAKVST